MRLVPFQNYKGSCGGAEVVRNEWACRVFQVQGSRTKSGTVHEIWSLSNFHTFTALDIHQQKLALGYM